MAKFKYKARDSKGLLQERIVVAGSEVELKEQLQQKGLLVVNIKEEVEKDSSFTEFDVGAAFSDFFPVSLKHMVIFCRQYSALINAGVAMMRALTLLAEQCESPKLAKVLKEVKVDVERGTSLSDAFAKYPAIFDSLFLNLIKAGETSGALDSVLMRLAKFMEYRAKLNGEVRSAMTYPTIVTIFAIIIFFVMLTFILPKFAEIFSKLGSELPAYTQFLINLSELLRSAWLIVILGAVGATGFALKKYYETENGKYTIDKLLLRVPVVGSLLTKIAVARFSRTFGLLLRSGVPILTSLEIVQDASGNAVLARIIANIRDDVNQGGSISGPLQESGIFPPMVVSMIAIGEETGELDGMLEKIADFYDMEVEAAVEALTSMIEPFMMVLLGGMVGAVIVGMYLPMFKMFEEVA